MTPKRALLAEWRRVRTKAHQKSAFEEMKRMKKSLPENMFVDPEKSRLTLLRNWVLDHEVTEIEMKERQFWTFAQLQPLAEKPWITFMGRRISVSDMPEDAQRQLGIFDRRSPGTI
jgi:hypothetical protein